MKGIKTILGLLVVISVMGIGLIGYAQPNIPKKDIPSNIPADIRKQIMGLYSSDPTERVYAAVRLGQMGARAVPAIPFLIGMFVDGTPVAGRPLNFPGKEATKALVKIGKPAVQPLIAALKDENLYVRLNAAKALGNITDPRAVEPLIAALKDENRWVRKNVAEALVKIGEPAIKPLIAALKDENSDVRWMATKALVKIGKPAVQPLIAALKDENLYVRRNAAYALWKITGEYFAEDL